MNTVNRIKNTLKGQKNDTSSNTRSLSEPFYKTKETLKTLKNNIAALSKAISTEERQIGTDQKKRKWHNPGCSRVLNALTTLAKTKSIECGIDNNFVKTFEDSLLYIEQEELNMRTDIIKVLDVKDLEHKVKKAREIKHEYYKMMAQKEHYKREIDSLAKSGTRDSAAKLAEAQHSWELVLTETAELEQRALDAMLTVHETTGTMSIEKMMDVLRIQMLRKKKQYEHLEAVCDSFKDIAEKISEHEEVNHSVQNERRVTLNNIRKQMWTSSNSYEVLCQNLGYSAKLNANSLKFLRNEGVIQQIEKVLLIGDNNTVYPGQFYLTNYQVYFNAYCNSSSGGSNPSDETIVSTYLNGSLLAIPIQAISQVESRERNITLLTEDLATFTFSLQFTCAHPDNLRIIIENFAFSSSNAFAYYYKPKNDQLSECSSFNLQEEYENRLQIVSSCFWRISNANEDYSLCSTYPSTLIVPKSVTDSNLFEIAGSRTKNRIPVLCWKASLHNNALLRSSQPTWKIGPNNRSDAPYLEVLAASSCDNILQIYDARPQLNAVGNIAKGGGWEDSTRYKTVCVTFLGIANIHVVRNAFMKMHSTYLLKNRKNKADIEETLELKVNEYKDDESDDECVENVEWYLHVSLILEGAKRITMDLLNERSVLVHCSDGWDRTSQLTSLAMIFLDPFYRTIEGFQVLIEKEWLSFGHKFAQRLGHLEVNDNKSKASETETSGIDHHRANFNDPQRSPIFIQWLDCVFQVQSQFPNAFQFNGKMLEYILHHAYSGMFGNFFHNCERERVENDLGRRTVSLWTDMREKRKDLLNADWSNLEATLQLESMLTKSNQLKAWPIYEKRWSCRKII